MDSLGEIKGLMFRKVLHYSLMMVAIVFPVASSRSADEKVDQNS